MDVPDLIIPSLRGGLNEDPPHTLQDDQCTIAENVEFFYSTLGERRLGCKPLSLTSSGLTTEAAIVYGTQWFPTNNVLLPEVWAVGATASTSVTFARRNTSGVWGAVSPADAATNTSPQIYNIRSQALGGLLFFAYASAQDRMHVWDQTTLRRSGLAQPAVPTLANEGVGTISGDRYYRVRYVRKSGATVLLRSEPSDSVLFTPSGTGAGVRITRPILLGESETHWEVEASIDDANYYVIATVIDATTTYDDTTNIVTTDYADLGDLSEDIGEYLLLPSAKYVSVDDDRILLGGHFTDDSKKSQIAWTPVANDPGKGNSERLPLDSDNTLILDGGEGGEITGISRAFNGTWYAFKWDHIYKLTRTGSAIRAYAVLTLSKTHGAVPGSLVHGEDENGRPCLYFLDPMRGPSRLGTFGIQVIHGLRETWRRVNLSSTIVARGEYYAYKQQVIWYVSFDGSDVPAFGLKLQVNEQVSSGSGASRGWSTVTGRISNAYSMWIINEITTNEYGDATMIGRPFVGLTAPDLVQRCDDGLYDAGIAYFAHIRSKPFIQAGLLNRWGSMTSALLATADATAAIKVTLVRDFDIEETSTVTDLSPEAGEDYVIKPFDALAMSSAKSIQFDFADY